MRLVTKVGLVGLMRSYFGISASIANTLNVIKVEDILDICKDGTIRMRLDANTPDIELASNCRLNWSGGGDPTATARDVGLERTAGGVLRVNNASSGNGWLQQSAGRARVTTPVTNATTTFSNLTDLSITLIAGRKYTGRMVVLASDSTAADGVKFDFNGGAATMTSFAAGVTGNVQAATAGTTISTSLAGAINFTATNGTGTNYVVIDITMVVNAGGTFIPRFAQNAHSTGTATADTGSYLWLEDSPN